MVIWSREFKKPRILSSQINMTNQLSPRHNLHQSAVTNIILFFINNVPIYCLRQLYQNRPLFSKFQCQNNLTMVDVNSISGYFIDYGEMNFCYFSNFIVDVILASNIDKDAGGGKDVGYYERRAYSVFVFDDGTIFVVEAPIFLPALNRLIMSKNLLFPNQILPIEFPIINKLDICAFSILQPEADENYKKQSQQMKRNRKKASIPKKYIASSLIQHQTNQQQFHLSQSQQVNKVKAELLHINFWGESQNINVVKRYQQNIQIKCDRNLQDRQIDGFQSWAGEKMVLKELKKIQIESGQNGKVEQIKKQILDNKIQQIRKRNKIRYHSGLLEKFRQPCQSHQIIKNNQWRLKYQELKGEIYQLKRRKNRSKSQIAVKPEYCIKQAIVKLEPSILYSSSNILQNEKQKIGRSQIMCMKKGIGQQKSRKMGDEANINHKARVPRSQSNGKWINCHKNGSNLTRVYYIS